MTRRPFQPTPSRRRALAAMGLALPLLTHPAQALSARETAEMKQLAPIDRMIQVCYLKLEDRIARETRYRQIDRVVMDAFSRGKIKDRTLKASGAAFRNRGNWFKLRFRCAVTPDRLHTESLEYEIVSAEPIARDEWERHRLFP